MADVMLNINSELLVALYRAALASTDNEYLYDDAGAKYFKISEITEQLQAALAAKGESL